MKLRLAIFAAGLAAAGLALAAASGGDRPWTPPEGKPPRLLHATFAAGCFWCMESPFDSVPGVYSTTSGYAGGHLARPTYEQVSTGTTGHAEVVQVAYDPAVVDYEHLLEVFWANVDPTDGGGQFCDRGTQYRPAVFFENELQKAAALASKQAIADARRFAVPIAVQVEKLEAFYPAEEHHQNFCRRNPLRYKAYRSACARDRRLAALWGKDASATIEGILRPAAERAAAATSCAVPRRGGPMKDDGGKPAKGDLRSRLTPLQYRVTQEEGTEPAFRNEYWDNHEPGLYVDVVSGEPLFSSLDKYDSGSGWPSFTKPLDAENLTSRTDTKLFVPRTEVRSKKADSHLGHLFPDGPAPTGQRYCINSAALRFVPVSKLEEEGYAQYKPLFEKATAQKK